MESDASLSWVYNLFNHRMYTHSKDDRFDVAIKKDYDYITYMYRVFQKDDFKKVPRSIFLNSIILKISIYYLFEEKGLYPLLLLYLKYDIAKKLHARLDTLMIELSTFKSIFLIEGLNPQSELHFTHLLEHYENHFRKVNDDYLPIMLNRLNNNQIIKLSHSFSYPYKYV
ncbi:hypothetical protein K502DRAFT_365218 [Neoconidiobolus thromboides FSU 785]|nr:hypothetical protein K502DRAFT_365218 [Neoconidiobolus thromboides FSU 785]